MSTEFLAAWNLPGLIELQKTSPRNRAIARAFVLEAASGFEPENGGFADLCLTTWLSRRNFLRRHQPALIVIGLIR